jgi:hypothetical protein
MNIKLFWSGSRVLEEQLERAKAIIINPSRIFASKEIIVLTRPK